MKTINISNDSEYHTQRNNRLNPSGTCNTTASINALRSSNIAFSWPKGVQPEDHLTATLDSDEAWAIMHRDHSWAITDGYEPRHVHAMLSWAINEKLVRRPVVRFSTTTTWHEIIFNIVALRCAVNLSGKFTKFGHIVTLVGLKTNQNDIEQCTDPNQIDMESIVSLVIDDPYGNYHSAYRDHRGNNISFTFPELDRITKEYYKNRKWAHLFNR